MRSTIEVKDLSLAQWHYLQRNVPVDGRDFLAGLPRACVVFTGGFLGTEEFHVEMDVVELTGLLVVLHAMDLHATAEAALVETPGNTCPDGVEGCGIKHAQD